MRITIDNEDGLGAIDYTRAVLADGPITIERTLNKVARCTVELLLGFETLAVPRRRARVVVTDAAGETRFTGYLAVEPVAMYAGTGLRGPTYRARLTALSDDWLLNKQGSGASAMTNGLAVGWDGTALISQLTEVVQSSQGAPSQMTVSQGGNLRALGASRSIPRPIGARMPAPSRMRPMRATAC